MALARSWSVALVGVQGHVVEIEADLNTGIPGLTVIGLPDAALAESRDRKTRLTGSRTCGFR